MKMLNKRKKFRLTGYNSKILQETIVLWQPRSKVKLTEVDAAEILTSVRRYFDALARVNAKMKQLGAEGNKPQDQTFT